MGYSMRIAVVAPSCTLKREAADAISEMVASRGDCTLLIHPQCFESEGHFAGSDAVRLAALREVMADGGIDAVWFARGGYGSNRIAQATLADLPAAAHAKTYVGYSDAGFLLAGFHKAGLRVAHGPMPSDILRDGGNAAVSRSLDFMVQRSDSGLEKELDGPAFAFNLTVLSNFLGTSLEPDFAGRELIIEDVGEHLYRIDRTMFHVTNSPSIRRVRRIRLGRVSDMLENEPNFASDEVNVVRDWCSRADIPFGGRADIGHDAANRVVPFS